MTIFIDRVRRAALLDTTLYEEVEADRHATWQAVAIVVLASLAGGIGSGLQGGLAGVVIQTVVQLIAWYGWAYLTYFIGTTFLAEETTQADHGELLRTIGFSSAPGVLRVVGIIPELFGIVFFIVSVWMLVAMIVAVRQALDYTSTMRAVGVCIIGWVIVAAVLLLLVGPVSN